MIFDSLPLRVLGRIKLLLRLKNAIHVETAAFGHLKQFVVLIHCVFKIL